MKKSAINRIFIFAGLLMIWPVAGLSSNQDSSFALFKEAEKAISSGPGAKIFMTLGDMPKLRKLIKEHPSLIHLKDKRGSMLLHTAALYTNETAVNILIKAGADVNAKNQFDITPLYMAASQENRIKENDAQSQALLEKRAARNINVVDALLKAGADAKGKFILHLAIRNNLPKVVDLLIKAGADLNQKIGFYNEPPLSMAIMENRADEALDLLIKAGANLNETSNWPYENAEKTAPVFLQAVWFAAYLNKDKVFKVFIKEKNINVNAVDFLGRNAFHIVAAGMGAKGPPNYHVLEALSKAGVNINALDKNGQTPLDAAMSKKAGKIRQAVIEALSKLGAKQAKDL